MALSILLLACFNFMNLSTARSSTRGKEIGMRKVAGAARTDIMKQFLGETVLLSFIALALAVILTVFSLPLFNGLSGKQLTLDLFGNMPLIGGLFLITLLTGIAAGSYPAVFLSSIQPVNVIKGVSAAKGSRRFSLRKIIVIFQFAVTVILIFGTVIIYGQWKYMMNKDLGYDKSNVITMDMFGNFAAAKNEFLRHPDIISVTQSPLPAGWYGLNSNRTPVTWEGKEDDREMLMLRYGERNGTIIGVIRDFHQTSLRSRILPMLLFPGNRHFSIAVKIKPDHIPATLEFLETTWKKFSPGRPFLYDFLDDRLEGFYRDERKTGKLFSCFTLLAISISGLGLFGLAAFTAGQRTREIGIRKVMGASVLKIVFLLMKDFLKWTAAAGVIAFPAAYFAMNHWLDNFAFQIKIGIPQVLISSGIALAVTFLAIIYQAVKAASAKPVDSLKYN